MDVKYHNMWSSHVKMQFHQRPNIRGWASSKPACSAAQVSYFDPLVVLWPLLNISQ